MAQPSKIHFEEKILYKTHQHWIVLFRAILQYGVLFSAILGIIVYFLSSYSVTWTSAMACMSLIGISFYQYYLWSHSWLLIGNQKITLSVRNGLFSQFAMNIRYRNIRDSAVSKHSILGFLLKYGTIFVRSSANEGDFQAHFVPKVGKVYALINALSRYSDSEREQIDTIEKLHHHHQKKEFSHLHEGVETVIQTLKSLPGIVDALEVSQDLRLYIQEHEESRNHGVHEALRRRFLIVVLHDSLFREPAGPIIAKNAKGEVYFPGVPFPEVSGKSVISGSPSGEIHAHMTPLFPYASEDMASILVGWD